MDALSPLSFQLKRRDVLIRINDDAAERRILPVVASRHQNACGMRVLLNTSRRGRMFRTCMVVLGLIVAGSPPAFTQSADERGRKRAPTTTASGAHHPESLTSTGTRKPAGAPLDERAGTSERLEQHEKEIKEHTLQSICQRTPECKGGHPRR